MQVVYQMLGTLTTWHVYLNVFLALLPLRGSHYEEHNVIDTRNLLDLPPCKDTEGNIRLVKSLGSESANGRYRIVYDVTEGALILSVLDVAQNVVRLLSPKALAGVEFSPTRHSAIDLVYAWARELNQGMRSITILKLMVQLIEGGAVTQRPDGTSDAVSVTVGHIMPTLVAQATIQLYNLGIIGGEPLMEALRQFRAELVQHSGAGVEATMDAIDEVLRRWSAAAIQELTADDHHMIVTVVIGAVMLAIHSATTEQ